MRDFEKEYTELLAGETPDVWSRIEKGLDERSGRISAGPHRKAKLIRFMKYAGAAAAAVICICIAIPVISNTKQAANTAPASDSAEYNRERERDKTADVPAAADTGAAENSFFGEVSDFINSKDASDKKSGDNSAGAGAQSEAAAEEYYEERVETEETAEADCSEEADEGYAAEIGIIFKTPVDDEYLREFCEEYGLEQTDRQGSMYIFLIKNGTDTEGLIKELGENDDIAESELR